MQSIKKYSLIKNITPLFIRLQKFRSTTTVFIDHHCEYVLIIIVSMYWSSLWVFIDHHCEYLLIVTVSTYWSLLWVFIDHHCEYLLIIIVSIYWSALWVFIDHHCESLSHGGQLSCVVNRALFSNGHQTKSNVLQAGPLDTLCIIKEWWRQIEK
jgi:hypothetical protein